MKELAPFLAVALMLCVAAVCADRRRQLFWGRSLGLRLLPLFVVSGMARGFVESALCLRSRSRRWRRRVLTGGGNLRDHGKRKLECAALKGRGDRGRKAAVSAGVRGAG